jgi:prepilin-type N-terminal cleavage/methylation domain-containing protein
MSDKWQVTGDEIAAARNARSGHRSRACRAAASERRRVTGHAAAFTLIEIMIVVAIIGLIAAMGVPSIFQVFRREGMRLAVSDVQQLMGDARARAIYSGRTTQVVFYPAEKRLEITDAPTDAPASPPAGALLNEAAPTLQPLTLSTLQGSVVLPGNVDIAMLDINMFDYGASEMARVRFFPNGTCDELTLVLHAGDEWQKITLEFSTALASAGPVTQ